ncbi:hypothetical protein ACE6H2_000521 [Prunus campanulata]
MCEAGILPNVGALPNTTHVNITNDLGGDLTLTIHCKSGDHDLGAHVLPPLISYEFVFRPNMWWTTQYFCSVEWPAHITTLVESSNPPKKITVRITNTFEDNVDLTVHCKSKDDDLGEHLLHPGET